jgi:hypothetical protein
MKEKYNWDYTIKIKTKEGIFEYEKETLDNIDLLLEQHKDYEEVRAEHIKSKVLVKSRKESK